MLKEKTIKLINLQKKMQRMIDVDKLIVNPENYRFDPVENQNQAIDIMLERKSDELVNLAKHIIENGLDLAKSFRVMEIKKDLYRVLEGNRRVTVLKCLHNPLLIKSDALRNKFIKLKQEHKRRIIPTVVNCYIYKDEKEAAPFIKLDHTGKNEGAGLDEWGMAEKNRFSYKFEGKISPAMQLVYWYQDQTKSKIEDPNKLKLSTIDRFLGNVEARSYLGLGMAEGKVYLVSSPKEVARRLGRLFDKMLTEDVPVQEVYDSEKMEKFMRNLFGEKPENTKELTKVALKNYVKKEIKKKSLPKSSGRNTVVPYDFELQIPEPKINNVFHELKELQLNQFSNAGGVLLRVFLEMNIDHYMNKFGIQMHKDTKLSGKLSKVTEDLGKKGINKEKLNSIIKVITTGSAILSIGNFHEYMHSFKTQPVPIDLINTWDNIQEFFEILWGEISKKTK